MLVHWKGKVMNMNINVSFWGVASPNEVVVKSSLPFSNLWKQNINTMLSRGMRDRPILVQGRLVHREESNHSWAEPHPELLVLALVLHLCVALRRRHRRHR